MAVITYVVAALFLPIFVTQFFKLVPSISAICLHHFYLVELIFC